jgi:trigger factor
MQVQVAETGPCSRTVTITVPPARIKEHVDEVYASAARQARIPGFRPGKVPRKMLERKFGTGILQEAKQQIVNRCVNDALRDQKLAVVGQIRVEEYEQIELAHDKPLELKVRLDVRPTFELKDCRGIEVPGYETGATDQDVEAALKEIAGQKRSIKPVQEPAQDGDFLKVDLEFQDEQGQQVHQRQGVQINTRIPVAGTDPQAFQQVLTGAAAGQELELPLTFPETFEKEAVRGKPGKVAIRVHGVLRVTAPPVDDALAKGLDFASLDELRQDLRSRIGEEKERAGRQRQEEQILEALLEDHPFDLPETLVAEQAQASLRQFEQRLRESGMGDDEIHKRLEDSKAEAHRDAERRVRLFFLIDAIARKEKLFVTEGDVEAEIRRIAQHHNVPPGQAAELLEKNNQMAELRLGLLERKVRDYLRENAKIVDRKGA